MDIYIVQVLLYPRCLTYRMKSLWGVSYQNCSLDCIVVWHTTVFVWKLLIDVQWDDEDFIRFFKIELDVVVDSPKSITVLTASDKKALEEIPALIRFGRNEEEVDFAYCTKSQIERLFILFSDEAKALELISDEEVNITLAETIKLFLSIAKLDENDIGEKINHHDLSPLKL